MESLLAVTSIAIFAAITPGPNNFIVMQTASKKGTLAVMPLVMGVMSGSVALGGLVWLGLSSLVGSIPFLLSGITVIGAGYLIYVGALMVINEIVKYSVIRGGNSNGSKLEVDTSESSASFKGIFFFQFVNPKSLLLMSTLSAELALIYQPQSALILLIVIIASVSFICLSLWAWCGSRLSHCLEKKVVSLIFNTSMGLMLVLPASFLVLKTLLSEIQWL